MRGDGAAIGFLCGDVIRRIFHHSPSALGRYHLNHVVIVRGLVNYAAMALSPHFGLFILNCLIVYLPLVVYDVHECFYFHIVSGFFWFFCALVRQFALFIPALWDFIFMFQQNDIPGKPACPEFYLCNKLVSYVVVCIQLNVLLCFSVL